MSLSVIIPVYKCDDHLDVCLLSILGQVQMADIEVVCVPVASPCGMERLEAWTRRDSRIAIAEESHSLMDALEQGISAAQGVYLLFMNQTDTIASVDNLVKATDAARARDIQVLLLPKLRRKGINAFSNTESEDITKTFLPKDLGEVFSITDAKSGILLAALPLPYGNIYKRSYLASLFHGGNSFGSAGDLMVAMISLLHAEKISLCDVAVIECRYEGFQHPFLTEKEIQTVKKKLSVQIIMMLAANEGRIVAHNVMIMYLSWLIASCHPYSAFCQVKEYYKDIVLPMIDMTKNDVIPELFPYWQYLRMLSTCTGDDLIEVYSLFNSLIVNEHKQS